VRYIRWQIAPGAVGYHLISSGEKVNLRLPARIITGKLVAPQKGKSLAMHLVVNLDPIY
jgi:hypothetical protein